MGTQLPIELQRPLLGEEDPCSLQLNASLGPGNCVCQQDLD
jgi:hypothetical protein